MTFTHREQYSVNIFDDQRKSKWMDWMENNKLNYDGVNLKSFHGCAVHKFVWDPKVKT